MQAEFTAADLAWAKALADVLLAEFEDPQQGGFFFTATSHERLIHRPKPGQDHAMPSGNAVAAGCLARVAYLTDDSRYAQAAERAVRLFYPAMRDHPAGYAGMAIALAEQISPPRLLVLRGRGDELGRWRDGLACEYLPDMMVFTLPDGRAGLPAALDKPVRPEPVNGWLCRGVICLPPISDFVQLQAVCKEKT